MKTYDVIASIVTYKTPIKTLDAAVSSFLATELKATVIIVDNASDPLVADYAKKRSLLYLDTKKNIGFGSGHNVALFDKNFTSKYFVVLNPDTVTHKDAVKNLYFFMENNPQVTVSSPKVLNSDGSIQYVHRRLPTISILFGRRFLPSAKELSANYELRDFDYTRPINVPALSGCFMFFRRTVMENLGGFDQRYFLFMEDVDICRRARKLGPTVMLPTTTITHLWSRGSHKSLLLTFYHIVSSIKYFLKWGRKVDLEAELFQPT